MHFKEVLSISHHHHLQLRLELNQVLSLWITQQLMWEKLFMPRCSQQHLVCSLWPITLLGYLLSAIKRIGQHIYGTSARHNRCSINANYSPIGHGQPYCLTYEVHHNNSKHINISFYPDLSEILSPVTSAPMRVYLCYMNGRPQCANLSQIFTSTGYSLILNHCHKGVIAYCGYICSNMVVYPYWLE